VDGSAEVARTMKTVMSLVVAVCLLASACASRDTLSHQAATAPPRVHAPQSDQHRPEPTLYLHLFTPRYYTDPAIPPRRVVTARVRPSQEISIAVGHPAYSGDEVLSGRIEQRGDKFFAHLKGRSHTTANLFDGEMELEKPVEPQGGLGSGGIWSVRFVLSTNSDCSPFLGEAPERP